MIAIDIGNSRLKWAVLAHDRWISQGAIPLTQIGDLTEVVRHWPAGARVVGCNVAGEAVEAGVLRILGAASFRVDWLRSSREACGVRNAYDEPEGLGADRWAALIGARTSVAGQCLVVCAGTATTINVMDAEGNFRGGAILPGVEMMIASLAEKTAQLPLAFGAYRTEPRNTMDAIVTGCLHAQAGAIERMFAQNGAPAQTTCLLTGGGAATLGPLLSIPSRLEENLILDGLKAYARSLVSERE